MYFTARRYEANLRGTYSGWLVFAVNNKTRRVVGTDYRPSRTPAFTEDAGRRECGAAHHLPRHSRIGPRWWVRAAVRDSRSAAAHSYCEERPLLRPHWRRPEACFTALAALQQARRSRKCHKPNASDWASLGLLATEEIPRQLMAVTHYAFTQLRISEHRDRPFRLIVTAHFANA